jgi:hypothetical protein
MTVLVRGFEDIRLNVELNQLTILVLLDFSKALVSISHGLFNLKVRLMAFLS